MRLMCRAWRISESRNLWQFHCARWGRLRRLVVYLEVPLIHGGSGKRQGKRGVDSDWDEEYGAAESGGWSASSVSETAISWYSSNNIMPDRLYVELVRVLLDSKTHSTHSSETSPGRLAQLAADPQTQPLAKLIQRQLDEHARYQLFWAHVAVCSAERPNTHHQRLIPILYRVEAGCRREEVKLDDCRRCVPLSQVATVLERYHGGGAHLKDRHATISRLYCGIPRKAVRLFADRCHVCNRVDTTPRNRKTPRAIIVKEVRARYTLDLIDMDSWRRNSTGLGAKC